MAAAFYWMACSKELKVDAPDFDVKVEKTTYAVGDTVIFRFSGAAENITFYSGLPGFNYRYINRLHVEGGAPRLQVTTQYGGGGNQLESLRLMVSSDLQSLSAEGVANATWADITSHAKIAINTTIVPSGVIDLSEWVDGSRPFFFAFKFVGTTDPVTRPGNWIIHGADAYTALQDGSEIPVMNIANAGWTAIDVANPASVWTARGTPQNQAFIVGGGANAPASEDWYISKPLFFTKVPPDRGVPIQNLGTNKLNHYQFVYSEPGTYLVTFLASNASADNLRTVARQVEIKIEP